MPTIAALDRQTRCPILAFRRLPRRPSEAPGGLVSFPQGLASLSHAMAERLGESLRLGQEAARVHHDAEGWEIVTAEAQRFRAAHLVLACGARTASCLLQFAAPDLGQKLASIRHTSLVTINLGFRRRDVRHPLDGYGFLVPRTATASPLLGALFSSSVFPHHAPADHVLLRVFLGGPRAPEIVDGDEVLLRQKAIDSIAKPLGLQGDPVLCDIARWKSTIPNYEPGHSQRVRTVLEGARRLPGLWLAGNFMEGISVNDCIAQGVRVAHSILSQQGTSTCPEKSPKVCQV
jgi:oxygen-dependent protoporphyrinogen oxidase